MFSKTVKKKTPISCMKTMFNEHKIGYRTIGNRSLTLIHTVIVVTEGLLIKGWSLVSEEQCHLIDLYSFLTKYNSNNRMNAVSSSIYFGGENTYTKCKLGIVFPWFSLLHNRRFFFNSMNKQYLHKTTNA